MAINNAGALDFTGDPLGFGTGAEDYAGILYTPNFNVAETGFGEPRAPSQLGGTLLDITGQFAKSAGDLWLYGQRRAIDAEFATPQQVNFSVPLQQTESGPRVQGQSYRSVVGSPAGMALAVGGIGLLAYVVAKSL